MGGKAYGVVARIITELTPEGQQTAVHKAGVKRQMAAVSITVDGEIFEVQVIYMRSNHGTDDPSALVRLIYLYASRYDGTDYCRRHTHP